MSANLLVQKEYLNTEMVHAQPSIFLAASTLCQNASISMLKNFSKFHFLKKCSAKSSSIAAAILARSPGRVRCSPPRSKSAVFAVICSSESLRSGDSRAPQGLFAHPNALMLHVLLDSYEPALLAEGTVVVQAAAAAQEREEETG